MPEEVAMLSFEVAEPPEVSATVTGVNDIAGPKGETVAVRFTLPANPF